MGRWEPDAQGRLQEAAFALFAEQGFAQTTVSEIAERAGLRERSFFRYFTDKREVLFAGQDTFVDTVAEAVSAAPPDVPPLAAAGLGFAIWTSWFDERRDLSRARRVVIDAHPELRERELAKMARLGAAIARSLRERGEPRREAVLAGDAAVAAFRLALGDWIAEGDEHGLGWHIEKAFEHLHGVVGRDGPAAAR